MTLIEQIKADREAGMPQQWQAETTTCRDLPDTVWALYWDKTPGGRKNADGSTSYSIKFPILLASDWMGDQEKSMGELADLLNFASRAKAALLAAEDLRATLKGCIEIMSLPDKHICCSGYNCGCEGATEYSQAIHYAEAAIAGYEKAAGTEE